MALCLSRAFFGNVGDEASSAFTWSAGGGAIAGPPDLSPSTCIVDDGGFTSDLFCEPDPFDIPVPKSAIIRAITVRWYYGPGGDSPSPGSWIPVIRIGGFSSLGTIADDPAGDDYDEFKFFTFPAPAPFYATGAGWLDVPPSPTLAWLNNQGVTVMLSCDSLRYAIYWEQPGGTKQGRTIRSARVARVTR